MSSSYDVHALRRGAAPILPENGISGFSLAIVIGVLAFLAGIAMTGFFAVDTAVRGWSGELTGTITIQVRGASSADIETSAGQVLEILQDTDGLANTTRLSKDATMDLLRPWIGTDVLPDDLPLPALYTAEVTPELRQDLAPLRRRLADTTDGASLNDHGAWTDQLVRSARRVRGLAFVAFVLVIAAAASVIVFAARAGLTAHRNIVEVLHLVGATDGFIASQIGRRYLVLGTLGGAGGAVGAVIATKFLAVVTEDAGGFLPSFSIGMETALWLLVIPVLLGGLATVSARIAVLQTLRQGSFTV
ncbi:MAG: FtsX-like permease family protein [Pseudomonadota bacterium]